jgi:hypothetical protein
MDMPRPKITAAELLAELDKALEHIGRGKLYDNDGEPNGEWAIATEQVERKPTGRVFVVCFEDEAMDGFMTEARKRGHTVEEDPMVKDRYVVTPKS